MNPLLMAGLLNLGGGALGGIFGGARQAQQKKREMAWRRQIMELLGPQAQLGRTNQFYQQFLQSPAFAQAQRGAAARGNQMQNNLGSSLAARGIGQSGIGAVTSSLAKSAAGNQMDQARTHAYGMAGQQAQHSIGQQLAALQSMGPESNLGFGQGLQHGIGGGISDFSNFLLNYQGGGRSKKDDLNMNEIGNSLVGAWK